MTGPWQGLTLAENKLWQLNTEDPEVLSWSVVESSGNTPSARAGHGFLALGSKIFLHGGDVHTHGVTTVNDMHQFSTTTNAWVQVEASGDPPSGRYFHGFGFLSDDIFVHGGLANDSSPVDPRVVKYGASLYCIEQCKAGTFHANTATGSTACLSCPAGKFSDDWGRTTCQECPSGIGSAIQSSSCT